MALIKSDRVKETSTSTGATTFALAGAGTGYRTFSSVCAIGDTFYYAISNQSNGEWEAGLGTYSALNTLTRTAVHSSSNSGNVVTFTSGTKEVFLTLTARHLDRINDNGQSTAIGSKTSVVAVNDSATLPDLDLQFSELKTLTAKYGPTPSYSRASTGTYFNASGVLTSAAVNEPRFDHVLENGVWVSKGLLIEEQRTNIWLQSNNLNTSPWTQYQNTSTENAANSPDGTSNASSLVPNTSNLSHYTYQLITTSAINYSISFYAKKNGYDFVQLSTGLTTDYVNFNLNTGSVGNVSGGIYSLAKIESVGYGWYRCSVTMAATANTTDHGITIINADTASRRPAFAGDGISGILLYGFQMETGSFRTSHIPTTTASVTRSADVCQITGSAFTNLWNATEGSFAADWDARRNSTGQFTVYWARDSASNNTVLHTGREALSPPGVRFSVVSGSSVSAEIINAGFPEPGVQTRTAGCYKANDFAYAYNGTLIGTDNSGAVPLSPTDLLIGYDPYGSLLNGHISRLRYFRSRLDNTQLVNLSGGINTLAFKPVTGSGSVTVANEYSGINISVPNPLPITNGGTGAQTQLAAVTNLISNPPNDGGQYTLASKKTSGSPSFYWVDSTGYAPTLDLLFAADKSLTAYTGPTPSFSRASTGTFFNSSGVLTSAAINAPRFDHVYDGTNWVSKGLLIEEQRTNLATYSEDFSNAAYGISGVTVLANQVAAPDGNTTADKLTMTSSGTFYQSPLYGSAGAQAGSVWLRADSSQTVMLRIANDSGGESTTSTVTVTTSWQRFSVARTFAANPIKIWFGIDQRSILGGPNVAATIYGWGYQIETGSFPTSYIPTTTAAVTRSADVCQITGGDFSGFWNASEGSAVIEFDSGGATSASDVYLLNASTSGAFTTMALWSYLSTTSNNVIHRIRSGGSDVFNTNIGSIYTVGASAKIGLALKSGDSGITFNGGSSVTNSSTFTLSGINTFYFGQSPTGTAALNGHIARLRYYPTRLPNATLQVLST